MPFTPDRVTLVEVPGRPRFWRMREALTYERPPGRGRPSTTTHIAPPGTTDLASVPRALTWLIPTYGQYTKAVIVHDHLVGDTTISRFEADEVLRDAMKELGVPFLRRWLIWGAVSWATVATIVGAHLRRRRQLLVLPCCLGVAAGFVAAVWLLGSADRGDWWRWLLTFVVVAAALFAAAVLMDERQGLLGTGKSYGLLALTVFGLPFLAIGVLALIGIMVYAMIERTIPPEYGGPYPDAPPPSRAAERSARAVERAETGRRVV